MKSEKFSWVEITNPRAEREFDFLVLVVGEEKIIAARAFLGAKKAFPLNLARVLDVKLPEKLQYGPPSAEVRAEIRELHCRLVGEGGGVGVQREGRGAGFVPDLTPPSGVPGVEDDHAKDHL